ncbi:hypothetical protein FB451DRAFT_1520785 [Mycena latifolia]|nr:hypothetical protein FB451DRAFT_1520785 [Mycena latifolia]
MDKLRQWLKPEVRAGPPFRYSDKEAHLDTRSELARVKLDNNRLELANRALCQTLAIAEEKLARLPPPYHVDRLPHEILLHVLRYALPPVWLLDGEPLLAPFSQSIWSITRRTKLAIFGVSKTWHQLGVELLYEDVTLRRLNQMASFVSALQSREGLQALVRGVEIKFPAGQEFFEVHKAEIEQIFQLCPRLAGFRFCPTDADVVFDRTYASSVTWD